MLLPRRVQVVWFASLVFFGILSSAAVWYGAWSYRETHRFTVVFLNIGQGDSALIQFPNGQKMLVDCGPNSGVLAALARTLPFYDRRLDYLLVTHPDLDHYGGCVDVVKRYSVGEIITNGKQKNSDPYFGTWETLRKQSGALLAEINRSQTWEIASTTLTFFSPDQALPLSLAADDSNNYSIVFRLVGGDSSFLFTGDMELPLENALLKKYCAGVSSTTYQAPCPALAAKVLKVGHHGSKTSTGDTFLAAVHPREAIISVGKNTFGHPSLRVMKRLERSGATILRTDEEGDILMR